MGATKPIEPKQDCIEALRLTRPDVAIIVSRESDGSFVWDGDGPDPTEEGYDAYDVDVVACTIHKGELIEGRASLGGSYYLPDEPLADVHGYLPQMVDEAVGEMDKALAAGVNPLNPDPLHHNSLNLS